VEAGIVLLVTPNSVQQFLVSEISVDSSEAVLLANKHKHAVRNHLRLSRETRSSFYMLIT